MLAAYASIEWCGKENTKRSEGKLFGWLRSRREAKRSVDEATRRLVKLIDADEPPPEPDPVEELVRLVGESNPRPWVDGHRSQTFARRVRRKR
jgi:hypothetical protein